MDNDGKLFARTEFEMCRQSTLDIEKRLEGLRRRLEREQTPDNLAAILGAGAHIQGASTLLRYARQAIDDAERCLPDA